MADSVSNDLTGDSEIEAVQARIEHARHDLSETVEALVYKTDVPARASDAIGDGLTTAKAVVGDKLETARDAAVLASELAAEQAKLLSDATIAAASTASNRRALYGVLGIAAFVAVALFLRRRRGSKLEANADRKEVNRTPEMTD